jgi:hypothetical protein
MRPLLQTLNDTMISRILGGAKRLMAEVGIEIRGNGLRQRLLDHGLLADPVSQRILFHCSALVLRAE